MNIPTFVWFVVAVLLVVVLLALLGVIHLHRIG